MNLFSSKPMKQNKTWEELQQAVAYGRTKCSSLSSVASNFTFRSRLVESESDEAEIEDLKVRRNIYQHRLYYLSFDNSQSTLFHTDLPYTDENDDIMENLSDNLANYSPLLPSLNQVSDKTVSLSKEEELLQERKRVRRQGISSFFFDNASGNIVFSLGSKLFICHDPMTEACSATVKEVTPKHLNQTTYVDMKFCPLNSDLAAFVRRNDLWVVHLSAGQEDRLTYVNRDELDVRENYLSAGVASYIMQEEFDRYTGYYWQPRVSDSEFASMNGHDFYRILYEEVDESGVEIVEVCNGSSVDCYRYPLVGKRNAASHLKITEFQWVNNQMQAVLEYELVQTFDELFPNMEYLVRFGWLPDGRAIYVELLDRMQLKLLVAVIPLSCFVPVLTPKSASRLPQTESNSVYVILQEESDIWINVHNLLYFLPASNWSEPPVGDAMEPWQFIWGSERDGFRHLYLVEGSGYTLMTQSKSVSRYSDNSSDSDDTSNDKIYSSLESSQDDNCKVFLLNTRSKQLSCGRWEVHREEIWVDEKRKLVYFTGSKDSVLERHLYVVSYADINTCVQRLTTPGFSHVICMSNDLAWFVSIYSSTKATNGIGVYHLPRCIASISDSSSKLMEVVMEPKVITEEFLIPEMFDFVGSHGHKIYGMFYKPKDFVDNRKYPTVVYTYGGPGIQLVSNGGAAARLLRFQNFLRLGYVVVIIDNRGSSGRGIKFEQPIKHSMGTVEIVDQVEGLHYIANAKNIIDLSRVAIYGWSYGGYLSLMALAQRPDVFKVAIAGAPVTDWKLYDTGYTERYMNLPEHNCLGYANGSVINFRNRFPYEPNRLLIVHGLNDENVHFTHTTELINCLVGAGKPYRLLVYPNERHGLRKSESYDHFQISVLDFLQQSL